MSFSIAIILITIFFVFLIAIVKESQRGLIALFSVLINAGLSSYIAFKAILEQSYQELFNGGEVFGEIPVRVDALSGWFILLMNFTVITGILYGMRYMKHYENQSHQDEEGSANITLHFTSYVIIHFAMIAIYVVQNSLAFLCVWEMMAICSFVLVIFEHHKMESLKAGIYYLVQSHIGIVFFMIGFIWVNSCTGSYDFNAISQYTSGVSSSISFLLFLIFFVAFAIKAGFVPFHTWLPYAHPAAPSHVSGIMSGVIIKLGIFGILRMLLLIKGNYLLMGYTILIISVISGVYGVMLAIIQHNIKKLLAYHSIENIGIIGMGIGLGTIGLGMNNAYLAFAGFAGAMLHTLNHSLFKSLLFYCAGTIYQATHTMDIERLGGLIKKMPQTATLFLIAALAICGLPPFNGFISEFLIYSCLFNGIHTNRLTGTIIMVASVFGLVIIGGLAMLCFTKAFGIIFLGKARHPQHQPIHEAEFSKLFPKYLIVFFIICIGVLPQLFIGVIAKPVGLFTGEMNSNVQGTEFISLLQNVSIAVCGFILLLLIIFGIRKVATSSKVIETVPTWSCGYTDVTPKFQYTANSFVRSFRKLIKPMLMMNKKENAMIGVFPNPVHSETHPYDKMEAIFIDIPVKHLRAFLGRFKFLQNGNSQSYVMYGVAFIILVITIPLIIDGTFYVIELFKKI